MTERIFYSEEHGRTMVRKGASLGYYWSPAMITYLRRNYATTKNEDLCEWLGMGEQAVRKKAKELGLTKDKEWLANLHRQSLLFASSRNKKLGYPGRWGTGTKQRSEGFRRGGPNLSPEARARSIAGTHRYFMNHPEAARQRALKAWETKRLKQQLKTEEK